MAHIRPLWHIMKDVLPAYIDLFINTLWIQCITLCCYLTYIYYLVYKIFCDTPFILHERRREPNVQ